MTNPNDMAFPLCGQMDADGLTKREWFAGMALNGLAGIDGYSGLKYMAEDAVALADVLFEALNKEKAKP